MAENKIKAHKALIKYFKDESIKIENTDVRWWYKENLEKWENVDPTNSKTFPNAFTLDEYGENEIIETEVS